MTGDTPSEPWNDDRLDAAFVGRAALHPTPTDLTARTLHAVVSRRSGLPFGWRQSLAAIVTVAILLVALAASVTMTGPPIGRPATSPSSTAKTTDDRREVFGLPIRTVTEAIAIRDGGIDDGEIAVRAWYAPYFPNRACGFASDEQPVWPLLVACPEDRLWLMQDPEPVMTVTDSGLSWRGPTGPAISPAFGDIDRSWAFPIDYTKPLVELVVVGHFDDRRSAGCPADLGQACRDRFVVDRIDSVDGEALPTSQVDVVEGVGMPFEDVEHIIDAVKPGVSILSAVHVDGDQGLRRMEPALAERGSGLVEEAMLWVVGVLDAGELETYVIVDSTGSIYELTAEGPVLVALSTPGERVSPSPSPIPETPANLTIVVGLGTPVFIEVTDHTGFLEDARHATSKVIARPSGIARPGQLAIANLARDTILVRWTGTVCDRRPQLTIGSRVADGPPSVLHLTDERPGCDAMGVGRGVVIRFSIDIDAGDLDGMEEIQLVEPRPTAVVGLEVIDIEAALKVQAKPGDDREIAVGGWFIRGGEAACALPEGQAPPSHFRPPGWPLEPDCRAKFDQFVEDDAPRDLLSIQAVLGPLGYGWMEDGRNQNEVVFVGHFDDRRTSACDEGRQPACADAFWVDAIWYQGQLVATDWSFAATAPVPETPKGSRRRVETLDAPWSRGTAEILSVGLVTRTWLPGLEPVIRDPLLIGDTWDWHVTMLDKATKRIRTFVIADNALMDTPGGPNYRIYEIVEDEVLVTVTIID
jgi:hypothetical protein